MWVVRFVVGIVLALALLGLVLWLRRREIRVAWYEWLMGSLGLLLLIFAVELIITFTAEFERVAAWNAFFIFGLPALVLLGLAVFLPWWRLRPRKVKEARPAAEKTKKLKTSEAHLTS